MREIITSNAERSFVLESLQQFKRLDGRKLDEFRELKILYGKNWGSCYTILGDTKVFAQVTCDIQEPKATRPNEGLLYVNVELSPMAAPQFEPGGSRSELSIHLNRMLEKCLKESKAVDLESLCIIADEKVWALRVDVTVLNHEGNLIDCVSVAALAALCHFRRPDATSTSHDVIIHPAYEKDLIPIALHHYPVCVSFAFATEDLIVTDPTLLEEKVAKTNVALCINSHRELCGLHLSGVALLAPRHIFRCSGQAALRAKYVVDLIKNTLREDLNDRESGGSIGLVKSLEVNNMTFVTQNRLKIQLKNFHLNDFVAESWEDTIPKDDVLLNKTIDLAEDDSKNEDIVVLGENSAELVENPSPSKKYRLGDVTEECKYGEGGPSNWDVPTEFVQQVGSIFVKEDKGGAVLGDEDISFVAISSKKIDEVDLCEEDEVYVMNANDRDAAEKVNRRDQEFVEIATTKLQPKRQKRKKFKK